ncbi:hypothetical protein EOD39_4638 [Acipenser ruthenus]|uniref:Uncharacterized protein n=1 Tax=Acipenser ruthenus TaxID=7906 RepID=A0A444UHF1_ACIRT|nr:hypothetical protein EOD39_4638 [Acipenser ruthenus]
MALQISNLHTERASNKGSGMALQISHLHTERASNKGSGMALQISHLHTERASNKGSGMALQISHLHTEHASNKGSGMALQISCLHIEHAFNKGSCMALQISYLHTERASNKGSLQEHHWLEVTAPSCFPTEQSLLQYHEWDWKAGEGPGSSPQKGCMKDQAARGRSSPEARINPHPKPRGIRHWKVSKHCIRVMPEMPENPEPHNAAEELSLEVLALDQLWELTILGLDVGTVASISDSYPLRSPSKQLSCSSNACPRRA